MSKLLFSLGDVVGTPEAIKLLGEHYLLPEDILKRHATGDWGALDEDDRKSNSLALSEGGRIFSVYEIAAGRSVYVITEAGRERTTIMLPDEY